LLVFGNIENLVVASQGAVAHVNPFILGGLSLIAVIFWLVVGTVGTQIAIKYARAIEFMGGLIIFILGMQTVLPILAHWIGL
jgi:putative Mn2+ efflux pump MntP